MPDTKEQVMRYDLLRAENKRLRAILRNITDRFREVEPTRNQDISAIDQALDALEQ